MRGIFSIHLQRRVKIAPLVFGLIQNLGPQAPQRPALAHHWNQSIAMLIGHPNAHHFSTSHAQALELVAKRLLKLGGLPRVFFGVSLARRFQDPAQFSQPIIYPRWFEFYLMLALEPLLDFLGPLPPALLQTRDKLFQCFAFNARRSPAPMFAFQQFLHTPGFQGAGPVKKLAATNSDLFSNLCGCEL